VVEIKKTIKKYDNFEDTYKQGYIGLPKGFEGIKEPMFLTIKDFKKKFKSLKNKKKYPVLFYMHGSVGLAYGKKYKDAVLKENFIFFAPNSYRLKNRPTYKTPTKIQNYEQVHKVRVAEIFYNIKRLKEFNFLDLKNIYLMGSSEGALAAAQYKGKEFKGRIVAAYACENGYYSRDFKIGARKKDPFLNIIGTHDQYFGKYSPYEENNNNGHCAMALLEFKNAKVVLLPKTKHNVIENKYTIPEVVNFLKFHTSK
jgi:hypothetical protein